MNEPKSWLTRPGGIAERLRALHDATDLTGKELAERLGWAASKVTRVRKGITAPTTEDVAAWVRVTGDSTDVTELVALLDGAARDRRRGFRERMTDGQAPVQRGYNDLVAESAVVRYCELAWIPGFLQTRDYARRVFEEMRDLHGPRDDIDAAIAERLRRQQFLLDPAKRFDLLIDEPALQRNVFPADVMIPQLHYLLTWLDATNVRVRVLPVRGRNRRTPQQSFQAYDDHVIVEGFLGESEPDPGIYLRAFDEMFDAAAGGADARALIAQAIELQSAT